jgi:hypothetical protein
VFGAVGVLRGMVGKGKGIGGEIVGFGAGRDGLDEPEGGGVGLGRDLAEEGMRIAADPSPMARHEGSSR